MSPFHGTTVVAVRRGDRAAVAGDGQITYGDTVLKAGARKVRRVYDDRVVVGFAGATADALTLEEKFTEKLSSYGGNLIRAAVELAQDWRTDRVLRKLDALLIVVDEEHSLLVSGNGDVIEPEDGVLAIGSGAPYAMAAARALMKHSEMEAPAIAEEAIRIAADICLYTNDRVVVEEVGPESDDEDEGADGDDDEENGS